jgi:hypothetical protein
MPESVTAKLRREKRRLVGLGGHAGNEATPDPQIRPVSALRRLRDVLAAMPTEVRYRILELSIRPDQIMVSGEICSYEDAERLTRGLRQTGRYHVEPPKTDALRDKGFSFNFTARPVPAGAPGSREVIGP